MIRLLTPLRLLLLALLATTFAARAQTPAAKVKEFDAYVQQAVQAWRVPGLAVAVVKDDQVLLAKGYGVRELGRPEPVDAQTLFACASTTKAMTAACMGILVDEGKVKWDDPVVKHLPDFQLYDPYMTREITVRDLFTHNTGVGNADFLWDIMDVSSAEVLQKMRLVKPSYSLRSSFIYQNIFYLAAGAVIEKVSGRPWGTFLRERIFQPLQMTRSVPFRAEATDSNQTAPHYNIEGTISVITHTNADEIGPAGSVWSSIEDMSKWMRCMLDSSKYAGGRLLSTRTWTELFKPQVLVPPQQFYPTQQLTKPNWTTYGLGWFQHDYQGKKVNFHTGSLAGAIAIHGQLPEARLGIYVFGNYDHAEIRHALMYKAFDHFALGGTRDWSADLLKLYGNLQAAADKEQRDWEAKRAPNTRPTLPLEAYAGTYADPLYGEVTIAPENGNLRVVANGYLKATLAHWHYDTFRGWYDKKWNGKATGTFVLGADGKISHVRFDGIEFKRSTGK